MIDLFIYDQLGRKEDNLVLTLSNISNGCLVVKVLDTREHLLIGFVARVLQALPLLLGRIVFCPEDVIAGLHTICGFGLTTAIVSLLLSIKAVE